MSLSSLLSASKGKRLPSTPCRGFHDRAAQFNEAEAKRLQEDRADKQRRLDELPDDHHNHVREQQLQRDLQTAAMTLNSRRAEAEAAQAARKKLATQASDIATSLAEKEPELERIMSALEDAKAQACCF